MDKDTVLQLASFVSKRMEHGLERFYLLNFNNDDIWVGNYATNLIISKIDGQKTLDEIVKEIQDIMTDYSYEEIFNSAFNIASELLNKGFLIKK